MTDAQISGRIIVLSVAQEHELSATVTLSPAEFAT